ncbi:winged helix-turn-helix domain-containing protein [Streptomyces sp. NBC_01005]|uniref:winged helix-turn-helix domain-containing protein n=1 Tax=unclassified Streptomyces TaxID=2593676 RepID=UPI002E381102|nr:winged helix-turn-helix domain-containing protein [Streptomyces sp. NBC_01362]WSW03874.1 winged helix-turn-helix domain-containing protein [Streptomyces sp. NBC_01005]WTC93378.1 winged helix-turn-helix domain-containing protein [Streptomyces sp. NBC_01650]
MHCQNPFRVGGTGQHRNRRVHVICSDALASPVGHSTKQLAECLAISSSSASEHVAALRAAGLVTSLRQANMVRHTATALGKNLISAAT